MEKEPQRGKIKLIVVAQIDYPEASEILVSFPDEWELVEHLSREDAPRYVAAMPAREERPRPDRFYGLPGEINGTLNTYRHYKMFKPWPQPTLTVRWDSATGTGRIEGMKDLKVQLQPVGQAQVWQNERDAVLWECYMHGAFKKPDWQEELAEFRLAVEQDVRVTRIFTQPHEPSFEEGYTGFLSELGYQEDSAYPGWWSKVSPSGKESPD